tara:strand:- start:2793 stop:3332 length:540 start_codon:yes stop_codon:yes gene_type:complete
MSALRFLHETKVDESSGVLFTVEIRDVFTSDFDLYKVTFNNTHSGGAATGMNLRYINSGGQVLVDSNYDYARQGNFSNQSSGENDNENDTKHVNHGPIFYTTEAQGGGSVMYVSNPFNIAEYTFSFSENAYRDSSSHGNYQAIGCYTNPQCITGMQFHLGNSSASFRKLNCRVYGIRSS